MCINSGKFKICKQFVLVAATHQHADVVTVLDCSSTLHSPLLFLHCCYHYCYPWDLWLPFYLGCSPIKPWDSLSTYGHLGIACLASQASDWLGAFWTSLSGLQSSVTLCKTKCDWSLLVTARLEHLTV